MIAIAIAAPRVDHRRRTDHRPRRHRAGPGPAAASAAAQRNRLQHHADHPRPRVAAQISDRIAVLYAGPDRRDRSDRRGSWHACPSLHPRTAALPPDPGHRQASQARSAAGSVPSPVDPLPGLCVSHHAACWPLRHVRRHLPTRPRSPRARQRLHRAFRSRVRRNSAHA